MRKASLILGIIGGVIAILVGILIIAGGLFFSYGFPTLIENEMETSEYADYDYSDYSDLDTAGAIFTGWGCAIVFAGILGIIGGALVIKHNVLAAVLMLIGAVIALVTLYALISFILLLLGGIFALVEDKAAPAQPAFSPNFE